MRFLFDSLLLWATTAIALSAYSLDGSIQALTSRVARTIPSDADSLEVVPRAIELTSTVIVTSEITITSCAPTVTDCPADSSISTIVTSTTSTTTYSASTATVVENTTIVDTVTAPGATETVVATTIIDPESTVTIVESTTIVDTVTAPGATETVVATTIIDPESTVTIVESTTIVDTVTAPGATETVVATTIIDPASTLTIIESTTIFDTVTAPGAIDTVFATTIMDQATTVTIVQSTTIVDTVTEPSGSLTETVLVTPATNPGITVTIAESTTIIDTLTTPIATATVFTTIIETGPGSEATKTQSYVTEEVPVSVCPTLIVNPTYTPRTALPDNYTWGCPPGSLCQPPHTGNRAGCNFEAGLPADGYVCAPWECELAPPLNFDHSFEDGQQYNFSRDYYNLDPEDFGLNYSIFSFHEKYTIAGTKRGIHSPLPGSLVPQKDKRALKRIPSLCYNSCNDAALEAQSTGKVSALCQSDSAFSKDLADCEHCISQWASTLSELNSQTLLSSFGQWLDFCADTAPTSSSTARLTIASTTAKTTATRTVTGSRSDFTATSSTPTSPTGSTLIITAETVTSSGQADRSGELSTDAGNTTSGSSSASGSIAAKSGVSVSPTEPRTLATVTGFNSAEESRTDGRYNTASNFGFTGTASGEEGQNAIDIRTTSGNVPGKVFTLTTSGSRGGSSSSSGITSGSQSVTATVFGSSPVYNAALPAINAPYISLLSPLSAALALLI